MGRRLAFLLALSWIFGAGAVLAQTQQSTYSCQKVQCRPPGCHCASTTAPGRLDQTETPQFLIVTVHGPLNEATEGIMGPIKSPLSNRGGRLAPITYFMNDPDASDPFVTQRIFNEGNEIANNATPNITSDNTSSGAWATEVQRATQFLTDAGIPKSHIRGFRAPRLEPTTTLFPVLSALGLTYDASFIENPDPALLSRGLDELVWPHTLDFGPGVFCAEGQCPSGPIEGLWSIPAYLMLNGNGDSQGAFDYGYAPWGGPRLSDPAFEQMLNFNFEERYTGNRAPLILNFNADQLTDDSRRETLTNFLLETLRKPHVWMISMGELIDWMRDPVASDDMFQWLDDRCRVRCVADLAGVASYPNPTDGFFTVDMDIEDRADITLEVYDILGRRIHQERQDHRGGRLVFQVSLLFEPSGLYFYRVINGNTPIATGKVVRI